MNYFTIYDNNSKIIATAEVIENLIFYQLGQNFLIQWLESFAEVLRPGDSSSAMT